MYMFAFPVHGLDPGTVCIPCDVRACDCLSAAEWATAICV